MKRTIQRHQHSQSHTPPHAPQPPQTHYTFVHPTKSGGTSIETFVRDHEINWIHLNGHGNLCQKNNNPIIIVRDPIERFLSMYFYWKNGSPLFEHTATHRTRYKNISIKLFIRCLRDKMVRNVLYTKYIWEDHYRCQSYWIPETCYDNTIVVFLTNHLTDSMTQLFEYLDFHPPYEIQIPHVNASYKEPIQLDQTDIEFIHQYFKSDFELIEKIKHQPELFKKVFC